MNKYITDSVKNNLKTITKALTRPQRKAIAEVARGLLTEGTPILRHLIQNEELTVKKQAEKYSHHLRNVDLTERIEKLALKYAKREVNKYTIIAYDLSDINKDDAKEMERIRRVFDGSKRKTSNGYTFHGVGINHLLIKAEIHDGDSTFLPQIRKRIVTEMNRELGGKGVWVFDRGNDDKAFFHFLRTELNVQFIARLKANRQVVLAKTGVICKVGDLKAGQYAVYLMNRNNNKVDPENRYRLVIYSHLRDKESVRLLTTLPKKRFSKLQIVNMYLERWGIENSFKRIKGKFNLERIRVLKHQTFLNLIALILFTLLISTIIFQRIQQMNQEFIASVLMHYKRFIKLKSLAFNLDSFISFLKTVLPKLNYRNHDPPNQLNLFSRRGLEKLGSF
jgi:hypothetical protein